MTRRRQIIAENQKINYARLMTIQPFPMVSTTRFQAADRRKVDENIFVDFSA
jgi:hypothetical protein